MVEVSRNGLSSPAAKLRDGKGGLGRYNLYMYMKTNSMVCYVMEQVRVRESTRILVLIDIDWE